MWTRELLKTNAKQALQGRYWRSFWICLVLSFVGLGGAGAVSYTHLDVYKRQALTGTRARPTPSIRTCPSLTAMTPVSYTHLA